MDTRCSARPRETQTIGQLSAIRCVRAIGVAWAEHSASSAANSHEVARLFTGFSIGLYLPKSRSVRDEWPGENCPAAARR